jgi:DNA-binding transcriptional regulator YiaG
MRTELCGNCGQTAQMVRKNYEFTEMGIPVELQQINVISCSYCGNVDPVIPNINGLMHVLALGIVCSPCKLRGEEVRFLRKYVNKSAREFSRYLHIDHTHLSKLENDRYEIGKELDKLVRLIVVNMSSELKEGIKKLMEIMPDITDDCSDNRPHIQIDPANLTHQYA